MYFLAMATSRSPVPALPSIPGNAAAGPCSRSARLAGFLVLATSVVAAGLTMTGASASASITNPGTAKVVLTVLEPARNDDGSTATGMPVYAADVAAATKTYSVSSIDAKFPAMSSSIAANRIDSVFAFMRCPTEALVISVGAECQLLGSEPSGAVLQGNQSPKLSAGSGGWKIGAAGRPALGMTTSVAANPSDIGTFIGAYYTVKEIRPNGTLENWYGQPSEPRGVLVVPRIPRAGHRPLPGLLKVGLESFVLTPVWTPVAGDPQLSDRHIITAFVCDTAAQGQSRAQLGQAGDGCRSLGSITKPRDTRRLAFSPPPSSAGKYLVIEDSVGSTTTTGSKRLWTWVVRSNPLRIAAAEAARPNDGGAAALADGAAGGANDVLVAGNGGEAAPSAAPAASAPAEQASSAPAAAESAANGANAEAGADSNEARLATGAGVDLGVAPLANASGQGTGASAELSMQLAASAKVNRGRYISMKALIGPKSSTGKVRIALVRSNAKGKVISSKAIYAPVRQGVAIKRWRIPRTYTPAEFTLVATYVPTKPGAPGITRTAPVSIG